MTDYVIFLGIGLYCFAIAGQYVNCQGVGHVQIGVPPGVSSPFQFTTNDDPVQIPVYLQATDGGIDVPLRDFVNISCVFIPDDVGYSRGTVDPDRVDSSAISVLTLNLHSLIAGRESSVQCSGVSDGSATGISLLQPQFSASTSISSSIPFTVLRGGTVGFVSAGVSVPNVADVASTFQLILSEPFTGGIENLVLSCSKSSTSASPMTFDIITLQAELASDLRTITVPYNNISNGDPVTVSCKVNSSIDNSFRDGTSEGFSAEFVLDFADVKILPTTPDFLKVNAPELQVILSLGKAVTADDVSVTFKCNAEVHLSLASALSEISNPNCSFTLTDSTSTGPSNNNTDAQNQTSPVWKVTEEFYEFQIGDTTRPVLVMRSQFDDVTELREELVLITCCVPDDVVTSQKFIGKTATVLATVFLSPIKPLNTTAALLEDHDSPRAIANLAYEEVAPCECDLTPGGCDLHCCCDQDCGSITNDTFSTCIAGLDGGLTPSLPEYMCSSTRFNKADWFPLLCVEWVTENAHLGLFYSNENALTTPAAFNTRLQEHDDRYTYREDQRNAFAEQGTSVNGYRHDESVRTGVPKSDWSERAQSSKLGVLALPASGSDGNCQISSPVQYLVNRQSQCTYRSVRSLCTSDSVLSAKSYAEATGLTNPPSPKSYHVLSDGKLVAPAKISYYCQGLDPTSYVKSGSSNAQVDNVYSKSQIAVYSMNSEVCSDQFRNNLCLDGRLSGQQPANLIRCAWDDSFSSPPIPEFNQASRVCSNVILDVKYLFVWSGITIQEFTAVIILGDVSMEPSATASPMFVTQNFSVIFQDNATTIDRSGNPGYEIDKPVYSGIAVVNGATGAFETLDTSQSNQMAAFHPAADGLCVNADHRPLTFGLDVTSACIMRLGVDEINNCSSLRQLVFQRLNKLMASDRIGRLGWNDVANQNYWVTVNRQDVTEYLNESFRADNTSSNVTVSLLSNLTGICYNVTSGIHLTILYAVTGQSHGNPINEIIGARINYTISPWQMTCTTSHSSRCYDNSAGATGISLLEPFMLTSTVTFTQVPATKPADPLLFWKNYDEGLCRYESCWGEFIYPLTAAYQADPAQYTLAFTLVSIMALLFYLAITYPPW